MKGFPLKSLRLSFFPGHQMRAALMSQCFTPPDLDAIFSLIEMPDLTVIFNKKRDRFVKRTSSAQWGKMPSSFKF